MKKNTVVFVALYCCIIQCTIAQPSTDSTAPYFKHKGIPSFSLLLHDSTSVIKSADLSLKPILALIYFSPSCGHCQEEAKLLIEKIDSTPNVFYVWIGPSHALLQEIKEFAVAYKLNGKQNLIVGKETSYFLPTFFRMQTTPYCAVYQQNKLFVEFRSGMSMRDFIAINNHNYNPMPLMEQKTANNLEQPSSKKEKKKFKKPE